MHAACDIDLSRLPSIFCTFPHFPTCLPYTGLSLGQPPVAQSGAVECPRTLHLSFTVLLIIYSCQLGCNVRNAPCREADKKLGSRLSADRTLGFRLVLSSLFFTCSSGATIMYLSKIYVFKQKQQRDYDDGGIDGVENLDKYTYSF